MCPKIYELEKDEQFNDAIDEKEIDATSKDIQNSDSSNFQSNKSANESIEESQAALNFDDDEPVLNFESVEDGSEDLSIEFTIGSDNDINEEDENSSVDVRDEKGNKVIHGLEMEESAEDVVFDLKDDIEKEEYTQINHGISAEQMALRSRQRMERLREITVKLRTPSGLTDLESEPAYKRRDVELDDISHSSDSDTSSYVLGEDDDKNIGLKPNNFLHDNVD